MTPSIETHSGRNVHFMYPQLDQITFGDIAWALSRTSRYNGHTQGEHPYSVAQHSVWVAFVAQYFFRADKMTTLQALFHDAHEAYTGDIATPLKYLPAIKKHIKAIEYRLQRAIHTSLYIPEVLDSSLDIIKQSDQFALAVEAHHLMYSNGDEWAGKENVPEELFGLFWRTLPSQEAHELFWLAKNYIDRDISLEELWRSI